MDNLFLFKYFNCKTTDRENEELQSWLADDPDGDHRRQYQSARLLWTGALLHTPKPSATSTSQSASRSGIWKKVLIACTSIAAALALVAGTYFYSEKETLSQLSQKTLVASVPYGQTFELTLEDGTSLFMNAGTVVEYPVAFAKKHRKVKIVSGEAFFKVKPDRNRPFIVETFASDIRVLGTEFNVEVEPEEEYCATTLINGKVHVKNRMDTASCILEPNMKVSFDHGHMEVEHVDDAAETINWTKGLINLRDTDFEDLMRKYEKAFDVNIVIERESLPKIAYQRGKVRISDGIEHALNILRMATSFKFVRDFETNTIYIR